MNQQTQTPAANENRVFKSVIGTVVNAIRHNTTTGGQKVANRTIIDNRGAGGAKVAYEITAFGSAIPTLEGFAVGDLVLVRGRYAESPWQKGDKAGLNRRLTMANRGTKVLAKKGEGKKVA
jgi:Single-strand binding protein family